MGRGVVGTLITNRTPIQFKGPRPQEVTFVDLFNPQVFSKIPETTASPLGTYNMQIISGRGKAGSRNDAKSVSLQLQLRHMDPAFQAYGAIFVNWMPFRYNLTPSDAVKETVQLVKTGQFVRAVRSQGFTFDLAQLEAHTAEDAAELLTTHVAPAVEGMPITVQVSIGKDGRNNVEGFIPYQQAAPVAGATAATAAPAAAPAAPDAPDAPAAPPAPPAPAAG